jgi:hypothetical protein
MFLDAVVSMTNFPAVAVLAEVVARDDFGKSLIGRLVVGFDWVGDEMGYPFCALAHSKFREIARSWTKSTNKSFGIRYHAGENVARAPSAEVKGMFDTDTVSAHKRNIAFQLLNKAFRLHVAISKEVIKVICENDIQMRIGHGVAFLHRSGTADFDDFLETIAALLRKHSVVCELNPSSNHVLLADTHMGKGPTNSRALPSFVECCIPVILCTDNDGIWELTPCTAHGTHFGLAREFCDCILRKELNTITELKRLVSRAQSSKFGSDIALPPKCAMKAVMLLLPSNKTSKTGPTLEQYKEADKEFWCHVLSWEKFPLDFRRAVREKLQKTPVAAWAAFKDLSDLYRPEQDSLVVHKAIVTELVARVAPDTKITSIIE